MKKLQSTCTNMVVVLTLISLIAGAALGYVNELTAGPIEAIKAQQLADGIKQVLGGGEMTVEEPQKVDDDCIIYRTSSGIAVKATDGNAFGGTLAVLVGFGKGGEILGYKILETAETPGLGAKADTWFQTGGKGCIVGKKATGNMTVTKDGGEVDAITASTITSRAFLRCVNRAYAALAGGADAKSGATKKN